MGEVYRARDTRLDRCVAIKVLSPDFDAARRGRLWFEREARALSRLSHPHICTVYDIGYADIAGSDVPFLVMEMLDGETLATILARGPLPLVESITCAMSIADALASAHEQGIVHRDLKPANVMVTKSGVKLLDFGLAQLRGSAVAAPAGVTDSFLTSAGMVFGTVPYMAPEQLRGEDTDARTDVFAFGVLLHEMLTGSRPFNGDSPAALIAAILEHDAPAVGSLEIPAPASLRHIVRKCLAKSREDRWQTARDLRGELHWTLDEVRGAAPTRSKRWTRLAVSAAAVLAGALWMLWPRADAERPEPSLRQFTAFPGDEVHPSFSPDGGQIAFTWNGEQGDNPDIYIKRLDADTPLRLTTDPAADLAPAWSPDGSRIAFIRGTERAASIYLTAPVAEAARKLGDYTPSSLGYPSLLTRSHHVAWSPDSRVVIVAARVSGERPSVILAFPAAGGEPHTVLSATREEGDFRFPTISPDGGTLAYASCWGEGCDVYVIGLDEHLIGTGDPKRLTRQSAAPSWGSHGPRTESRSSTAHGSAHSTCGGYPSAIPSRNVWSSGLSGSGRTLPVPATGWSMFVGLPIRISGSSNTVPVQSRLGLPVSWTRMRSCRQTALASRCPANAPGRAVTSGSPTRTVPARDGSPTAAGAEPRAGHRTAAGSRMTRAGRAGSSALLSSKPPVDRPDNSPPMASCRAGRAMGSGCISHRLAPGGTRSGACRRPVVSRSK